MSYFLQSIDVHLLPHVRRLLTMIHPSSPILCLGLNPAIDRVIEAPGLDWGRHVAGRTLMDQPAGKALNVARTMTKLGRPNVHLLALVGQEEACRFERFAHEHGVAWHGIPFAGSTRHHLTVIDPKTQKEMHWREAGTPILPEAWQRLVLIFRKLIERLSPIVVITGSLPPGIGISHLIDLIHAIDSYHGPIALDMNGEMLAALQRALPNWHPWLVKPNRQELDQWLPPPLSSPLSRPTPSPPIPSGHVLSSPFACDSTALRRWLEPIRFWSEHTLVSLGADGVIAMQSDSLWYAKTGLSSRQRVIDTVGCGDAMLGSWIDSYLQDQDMNRALGKSCAVAAANAMSIGAANFSVDEIHSLEPATQVVSIV